MSTTYQSAITALYALGQELASPRPRQFDLDNMRALVAELGHPERRFPSVLIAGTNGKGSTSATLASICRAAGYRTGLYTSPHLVTVNERIRILSPRGDAAGECISDVEFAEIYSRVQQAGEKLVANHALPEAPSFFEMLTAIAFEYFATVGVELAVLEVGLGGRLDATNVVEPCISVITDIALDHQQYLGDTIAKIAREKAGVMRRGCVVVTLPQHPQANDVIGEVATELDARGVSATKYVPNVSPGAMKFDALRPRSAMTDHAFRASYRMDVMGTETLIETPLVGRHQLRNVALAITAAEELNHCGFRVDAAHVANGVRETHWPGRFQFVRGRGGAPDMVLDVAHNPAGAWALRSALSESQVLLKDTRGADDVNEAERSLTLVFGAMRDKAIAEITQILFPLANLVIATRADAVRSSTAEEIRELSGDKDVLVTANVPEAMETARRKTPPDGLIVVTGSIFLIGEVMRDLQLI